MAKKASDFRYNTGETKVPWAAVGENYNAEDLMKVVEFLMQGEGEEYEAALAAVREKVLALDKLSVPPGKLSLGSKVEQAEADCDAYLETTDATFITNCTAGFEIAYKYVNLGPGDEVIVDKPCWVSYPEMVRMAGGVPVFLDCPESQGFLPSMADLEKLITPRTKAFILNTPSNPNGCMWSREQLQQLADLAVKYDFYIVADEIYEKLVYSGEKHYSIATFGPEIKARTILINGVSKSYAMTGFRIGYACGPRDVIKGMVNYQSQATSAPNTAAQHAAAVALTMPQDCVEEMRKAFEQRRDRLVELINAIPGLSCRKPHGAFYVMMNIRGITGKRCHGTELTGSTAIAEALLEHAHVALVPGAAFLDEGFCRISYATSMENIEEGLRRIAAFVKELE